MRYAPRCPGLLLFHLVLAVLPLLGLCQAVLHSYELLPQHVILRGLQHRVGSSLPYGHREIGFGLQPLQQRIGRLTYGLQLVVRFYIQL